MMSPNCVTQLECVRGLLIWFGILTILFFILSYLSYPWWSSSFEVDLPLSESLSSVMVSLTLVASDSCLLNCHHLFFETSLILFFLQAVLQDLSYNSNAPFAWLELFHKTYASRQILMQHATTQPIQPSSISHRKFLDAFHLYHDIIEIVH